MSECDEFVERAEAFLAPDAPIPGVAELGTLTKGLRKCGRFDLAARLLIPAARRALYENWESGSADKLAKVLEQNQQFGFARRLWKRLYEAEPDIAMRDHTLREKYSLCTYKDLELPAARRYDRALEILEEGGSLDSLDRAEPLGQAGAIYKRKWENQGKQADLESALWCYRKGSKVKEGDPEREYCGINAAFVLDQLAAVDQRDARGGGARAEELQAEAQDIRQKLIDAYPWPRPADHDPAWDLATLAEAYFGLGKFSQAAEELAKVRDDHGEKKELWKLETTATQLASIARLRGFGEEEGSNRVTSLEQSDAGAALRALLGDEEQALRRVYLGKVGLALSGGGFRASLFHIGVLAKMAERGVLSRIEVLSCVSGGSIVGAHYYLLLRDMLQTREDTEITPQHYVDLVQQLCNDFRAAVGHDLRGRLTTNLGANWKMFATRYSRTSRVADLLDELIYNGVDKDQGDHPWRMPDLFVKPPGREDGFSPRYENWRRCAKVPILVINATALNTGHNWQYTASWMGEPPAGVDEAVDANARLRRMYYGDAPPGHQEPRLAEAVGASACVPGLFAPAPRQHLYEPAQKGGKEPTVELVDGGVHDNQGIASLLEQDCSVVLVSDASGQMNEVERPKRMAPLVVMRTNSILMSRVRGAQYLDLLGRRRFGALRGLMIVHLKKGLFTNPRDWIGTPEPWDEAQDEVTKSQQKRRDAYQIDPAVQVCLAALRTDLDAFSDAEALSLMAAGYKMADYELSDGVRDLPELDVKPVPVGGWPFEAALASIAQPAGETGLDLSLGAGRKLFFRGWARWRLRRAKRPRGAVGKILAGTTGLARQGGTLAAKPVRGLLGAPVAVAGSLGSAVAGFLRRRGR